MLRLKDSTNAADKWKKIKREMKMLERFLKKANARGILDKPARVARYQIRQVNGETVMIQEFIPNFTKYTHPTWKYSKHSLAALECLSKRLSKGKYALTDIQGTEKASCYVLSDPLFIHKNGAQFFETKGDINGHFEYAHSHITACPSSYNPRR